MSKKSIIKRRKSKVNLRLLIICGIFVIVLCLIAFAVIHKSKPKNTSNLSVSNTDMPQKPKPAPNTVVTAPTPTPTTNVPGGMTGKNDTSQASLTAPTGTFVSNHGQDSTYPVTATTTENSSCTTTPGASCDIKFINTQTGTSSDLGSKQTPTTGSLTLASGTASWTWTPQQVNLAPGDWTIEAVSTLNGQTKSTTDPTVLKISS